MVNEQSPMQDVVTGLKCADYAACYEFCRRQRPDVLEALNLGAHRLGEIAFELECRQPQALLAWKFPDAYSPLGVLPDVLDAACEDNEDRIYSVLSDAPFADLALIASACAHIKSAAAHIRRYGAQTSNPQQPLFNE